MTGVECKATDKARTVQNLTLISRDENNNQKNLVPVFWLQFQKQERFHNLGGGGRDKERITLS